MGDRGAMSGRPSLIQQREVKQAIRAARQAGAKQVEVKYPNGISIVVHLDVEDEKPAAKDEQIDL
jgi:hypothetical protein